MIDIYLFSTVREKYVPFEKRKTTDTVKGIVGKFSVLVNIHVKLRSYKDIQYKFYCMFFFFLIKWSSIYIKMRSGVGLC